MESGYLCPLRFLLEYWPDIALLYVTLVVGVLNADFL